MYFICTCQKNVLPLCREWDVQYLARGMVLLTSQRPSWSLFYFRYFVLNAYTFTPTPSIVHTILWIYAVTPNFSAYSILFSYPSITFFHWIMPYRGSGCFIRISMNNLSAKVQKTYEICKFIWKYFVISKKNTTFAPTYLKDIHNKDYSVV